MDLPYFRTPGRALFCSSVALSFLALERAGFAVSIFSSFIFLVLSTGDRFLDEDLCRHGKKFGGWLQCLWVDMWDVTDGNVTKKYERGRIWIRKVGSWWKGPII
uniref:Uncharacterized protein n=1 Tax=Solanum lycopersicum TaxID=4081 RepID=A0A3Q7GLN3_SOLLC